MFINEPWLIDKTLLESCEEEYPDKEKDNIRVYVPLDRNHSAILRRLEAVIDRYGEANEENEMDFSIDVEGILSQVEIYDQIWYVREYQETMRHSQTILRRLEAVIDRYGEANEENEMDFSIDVEGILSQVEIYDQIWYVREYQETMRHSQKEVHHNGNLC